jgi:predicted nucleotidyltransferase
VARSTTGALSEIETEMVEVDFEGLLRALHEGGVEFVVVGGFAATLHGSPRLTRDLDVVYRRSRENMERLAAALSGLEPYLRGAPPGLPFRWDPLTIRAGLNFTLTTTRGPIDLLGEITGGGAYEDLLETSIPGEVFGLRVRVVDLPTLIRLKRAAGRPKDFEPIAELEALLEEREREDPGQG